MQALSILTTMFLLLQTQIASANNSFQQALEEMIAIDLQYDDVIATFRAEEDLDTEWQINEIKYDRMHKKFIAQLQDATGKKYTLTGRYEMAQLLPVLVHPLSTGEKITEENLDFKKFPMHQDMPQVFRNIDSVAGRFAKNRINAGKPIQYKEVGLETLVQKGQTVRMIFQRNSLIIESLGVALDAGAQDEIVRVKNIDSHKVIRAKVKDLETVLVMRTEGESDAKNE